MSLDTITDQVSRQDDIFTSLSPLLTTLPPWQIKLLFGDGIIPDFLSQNRETRDGILRRVHTLKLNANRPDLVEFENPRWNQLADRLDAIPHKQSAFEPRAENYGFRHRVVSTPNSNNISLFIGPGRAIIDGVVVESLLEQELILDCSTLHGDIDTVVSGGDTYEMTVGRSFTSMVGSPDSYAVIQDRVDVYNSVARMEIVYNPTVSEASDKIYKVQLPHVYISRLYNDLVVPSSNGGLASIITHGPSSDYLVATLIPNTVPPAIDPMTGDYVPVYPSGIDVDDIDIVGGTADPAPGPTAVSHLSTRYTQKSSGFFRKTTVNTIAYSDPHIAYEGSMYFHHSDFELHSRNMLEGSALGGPIGPYYHMDLLVGYAVPRLHVIVVMLNQDGTIVQTVLPFDTHILQRNKLKDMLASRPYGMLPLYAFVLLQSIDSSDPFASDYQWFPYPVFHESDYSALVDENTDSRERLSYLAPVIRSGLTRLGDTNVGYSIEQRLHSVQDYKPYAG